MSFVVVEFLREDAVEVVHKSWIVKKENGVFCYWPPKAGASAKVKREEVPDTERWNLYEIRIFSFAETYTKALERAKKAEETSNIETEQECFRRRTTKKPNKFGFSDDEEADDEDGDNLQTCPTTVARLPQPPHLIEAGESTPGVSQRFKGKFQLTKRVSRVGCADKATSSRSVDLGLAVSQAEAADTEYRATLLARLKTVEENQRVMVNLLQSIASAVGLGQDDVDDVLPTPVCSVKELDDLCTKLSDDELFKKKMTVYLSSLGGHSLGDTVRRMIRKLGSNCVWSSYSLKGRKGKLAFADLPIYKVIIRACLRNFRKSKLSEVEDEISEALKHAQKRKGGLKYKEPEHKRKTCLLAQVSSDSES